MYGPGRHSSWNDGQIALGGNFSDFLPEDRFDKQPLWTPDRSACLVADVRLDNRPDLVRELDLAHPETLADSDILLAAWQRWGCSCPDHLIGSFAFILWSPQKQEVFAVRDHAGERPLFYHRSDNLFAIASMPKGLLALPGIPHNFNDAQIAGWLAALGGDGPQTIFAGITRLPPGHTLRVTPDRLECRQYWHPTHAKPTRYKRDEDYAEALVEILDRATEARLRSNTPVGSFLSAGLDSSSVTASAARLLAAQGKTLTAFTSVPRPGFNGESLTGLLPSEAQYASEVARMYPNIDHVVVDSRGYDLLRTMKTWSDAMDAPAVNVINQLWFSAIFDQAKARGISVLLQGLAGNISISWYTPSILGYFFSRGRWISLAQTIDTLRKRQGFTLNTAARFATRGLIPRWLMRRLIAEHNLEGVYDRLANPQLMQRYNLQSRIFDLIYCKPTNLDLERTQLFEYQDEAAMITGIQAISGIDVRDPTADKRVYDFCFSIPHEQYVAGGHTRSLVRRAMKDRLPASVTMRYTRGLQGADWYIPMTEALPEIRKEVTLFEQSPAARETLDLPAIQDLLDHWPQSDFHTLPVARRWHYALVPAISLGSFLRRHESVPEAAPKSVPSDLAPVAPPVK